MNHDVPEEYPILVVLNFEGENDVLGKFRFLMVLMNFGGKNDVPEKFRLLKGIELVLFNT